MGTFTPSDSNLGSYIELQDVTENVSYVDGLSVAQDVTITPQEVNPSTIIITDGDPATITGNYSDVFDNEIQYITTNNEVLDATYFSQIDKTTLANIIYYKASTTETKTYTYVAEADSESKTYTITLNNDWESGRDSLAEYVSEAKSITYPDTIDVVIEGLQWKNAKGKTVAWFNSDSEMIYWK